MFHLRVSDIAVPLECTPQSAFGQLGTRPLAPALQQQIEIADRLSGPARYSRAILSWSRQRIACSTAPWPVDAERAGAVGEHQLRPAPVRTITGPERVGAMVEDTGAIVRRASCALPPLDQQRQQARHQMLVLHDHGEFVAVVLAVQCST